MRRTSPLVAPAALLGLTAALLGPTAARIGPTAARAADAPPAGPETLRDLVYGTAAGAPSRLDLVRPPGAGPFPVVVAVHGGGWQQGRRTDLEPWARALAAAGIATALVDYRLAPAHPFPAAVEDVSCAVRWVRTAGPAHRLDPLRVAALGEAEGGHLALMLAVLGEGDGFQGAGGAPDAPRRVAAAVAISAPSDLAAWSAWRGAEPFLERRYGKGSGGLLVDFLGSRDRGDPVFAAASPVTWVSAGDAPVLSVHGEHDPIVPVSQARALHRRLAAAGVPERLLEVPGGGHAFAGAERARLEAEVVGFLRDRFGGAADAAPAPTPAPAPAADVAWALDLVYHRVGARALHLDLARPAGPVVRRPTVVCFHPGPYTPKARADLHPELAAWAAAGYAAVSVEYRGPVEGAYPTPVEDGRAALRALRTQADVWGTDPARVLVSGAKLGGFVALHLALHPPDDATPRPRGAIVRYAPTDLSDAALSETPRTGRLREVLVGSPRPGADQLRRASPLTYVTSSAPPVLLIHHPQDAAIPFRQTERLAAALRGVGRPVTVLTLTGSGHGAERVPQTPADAADAERVRVAAEAFARDVLRDE